MNTRWRKYPHPVLSSTSDDFIDSSFSMDISMTTTDDSYCLELKSELKCPYIEELIKSSKASFALNVECSSTLYREIYKFNMSEHKVVIPSGHLDGKVELYPLIVSNIDDDSYFSESFNEDYNGIKFSIKKGDVLGFDNPASFDAVKFYESIKDIPSIFAVRKDDELNTSFNVVHGDHKIMIFLSKDYYEKYVELSGDPGVQPLLAASLVIPSLVYVLEDVRNSGDLSPISDKRWFMVLKSKLSTIGIDIEDPDSFSENSIVIAQKLLGNFYPRAIESIYENQLSDESIS